MASTAALPTLTPEPGFTHYLEEIRRFPMLERQEEYCWPSAGASTATAARRTSSSPAICGS